LTRRLAGREEGRGVGKAVSKVAPEGGTARGRTVDRGGERDVRVDREEGRLTRRSFGREVGGAVDKEGGRSYN
jgi:hypothetical protein